MVSIESFMDVSERQSRMGGTLTSWRNDDMAQSRYRQSRTNWKQVDQKQRGSLANTRQTKREGSSRRESREKPQEVITLDKFFGMNFRPIEVTSQIEGSEPPKYLDQDLEHYMEEEFEINETDEDMYSESNTLTNFDNKHQQKHNKEQSLDTRGKQSFVFDENRSIQNDTVEADEKIKRKIIEKYSKKKNGGQSVADDQRRKQSSVSQVNIIPEIQQKPKRTQANSQSPIDTVGKMRGSLTNFYQMSGSTLYTDNNSIENHIAFRNSFYNQKSNLENYPDFSKTKKEPKETINKYLNQKEKINELRMKEQDKYNKYISRFNLNKSDCKEISQKIVRERAIQEKAQQERARMQTPTLYFRSDFKKD